MLIISLTSVCSCAGSSSLCAALATIAFAHNKGARVLCADACENGIGACSLFGSLGEGQTIPAPTPDDPFSNLCRSSCGVYTLRSAPADFIRQSGALSKLPFDFIFIDSGTEDSEIASRARNIADIRLCVLTAEGNCLYKLDKEPDSIDELYVINRFDHRSHSMYECRLILAQSSIAPGLLQSCVPFDENVLESTLALKPFTLLNPICAASDAAAAVLTELMGRTMKGDQ